MKVTSDIMRLIRATLQKAEKKTYRNFSKVRASICAPLMHSSISRISMRGDVQEKLKLFHFKLRNGQWCSRPWTPTPPERGSFPLDHFGECKKQMMEYLQCMKYTENKNAPNCRALAKKYLGCRMDNQLMDKSDWDLLGLVNLPGDKTTSRPGSGQAKPGKLESSQKPEPEKPEKSK